MPTNAKPFNGRAVILMESADKQLYMVVTVSSPTIRGDIGILVAAPTSFTDPNFADAIKKLFGI
jgi:hypothetical protein